MEEHFCFVYKFHVEGFDSKEKPKVNEVKIYSPFAEKLIGGRILKEIKEGNYNSLYDFSAEFSPEAKSNLKSKIGEYVVSHLKPNENAIVLYDYLLIGGKYSVRGTAFVSGSKV